MIKRIILTLLFAGILFSTLKSFAEEEEPAEESSKNMVSGDNAEMTDEDWGVNVHGIKHNVAADRKIVKVGGVYRAEGMDIYLKRRLDEFSGRISSMEAKIDELIVEVRKKRESSAGISKSSSGSATLV